MLESLATMEAPKLLETQEHFERLLGGLMDKARERHTDLTSVPGNKWMPGDRCEDALLGPLKMDGAAMALDVVLQCELELDRRMTNAKAINEQDDPACD